jgi:hypothetical protein
MIAQILPIATTSAILILSLGHDFTQSLFVGIVTDLGERHDLGQTMGLKVFTLFTGFGSWIFGESLWWWSGPT